MSELVFGQASCMSSVTVTSTPAGSLLPPEVLQVEQLSAVAGGINPQPLPPCHKAD